MKIVMKWKKWKQLILNPRHIVCVSRLLTSTLEGTNIDLIRFLMVLYDVSLFVTIDLSNLIIMFCNICNIVNTTTVKQWYQWTCLRQCVLQYSVWLVGECLYNATFEGTTQPLSSMGDGCCKMKVLFDCRVFLFEHAK